MTTFVFEVGKDWKLEATSNKPLEEAVEQKKGLYEQTCFTVSQVFPNWKREIGRFYLSPFPGCCAIVVSHFAYLNEGSRGTEVSEPFRQIKQEVARQLGYTAIMATTIITDIRAFKSFLKAGYNVDHTFENKRTTHQLALGFKLL